MEKPKAMLESAEKREPFCDGKPRLIQGPVLEERKRRQKKKERMEE